MTRNICSTMNYHKSLFCRYVVLALLICFSTLASATVNQDAKISIHTENTSFSETLRLIEEKANVKFIYDQSILPIDKKITLSFKNASLSTVLNELCRQSALDYQIKNKQVILNKKKPRSNIQKKITGIVTDENGESLPGATVRINGESKGTVTDLDGAFALNAAEGDELIISYIGMKVAKISVKSDKTMNIKLESDAKALDEVVVTGYQTISKERATGSYNIIKKEALEKPTTNIASRLIGSAAGVQATTDANGNPKFEIRGLTSLGSNASPLVVVDGFAIEGDFNSINPNDVESITILKDAAAASIWGARSANGVIVVTTKSAKKAEKGKVVAKYSNFFKFTGMTDLDYVRPNASAADIIDYDLMAFNKGWGFKPVIDSKDIRAVPPSLSPSREAISEHYNGYLTDAQLKETLDRYRSLDNRSQIEKYILQNPFAQQHDLSLSFGSEKANAYSSVMYQKRDKSVKGSSDEKLLLNLQSNFKINKIISFNIGGNFMYNKDQNNGSLPNLQPYQMLVDENNNRLDVPNFFYMPNVKRYVPMDKFPYSDWGYNPITETENTDISTKTLSARFQAGMVVNILEGLSFNGNMQYEMNNQYYRNYYNEQTFKVRSTVNKGTNWDGNNTINPNYPKGGMLDQSSQEYESFSMRGMINYNREFNEKHSIALVMGTEVSGNTKKIATNPTVFGYDENKLTVGTFPNGLGSYTNPNLYIYDWLGKKMVIPQQSSFAQYDSRFFSLYANANYTYDGKYSISGSVRTDASNLITDNPKYRYAPFWSVGSSWQVIKEEFMKDIDWIDQLTVRATYGYNGNIDKSTSFKPLINVSPTNNIMTFEPSASISSYGNPTLRWEKTGTFDFGIDFSFFKGKLFGNIDYYNKQGRDLMSSISIPSVNGTEAQRLNTAAMSNQGVELELGTQLTIIPKELTWRGSVNLSFNKNKIIDLFRSTYTHSDLFPWQGGTPTYVEGKNAYTIWGLKYAGLENVGTESSPNMQPMIIGKDGMKYNLSSWPKGDPMSYAYDQGTRVAPWTLGFNTGFTYKNFDLSFILTGKFGHVFQRTSYNYNGDIPNKYYNEVRNADPMQMMPLPQNDTESRYSFWNRFWPFFTYQTESANHIRMQEIAVSYTFNKSTLKKIKLDALQIFAQANDVFSIYANDYHEDPEFKLGSYKPQPSFTIGLKVGF